MARPVLPTDGEAVWGPKVRNAINDTSDRADAAIASASTNATAITGKAATSHAHLAADVTNFNTAVDARIATVVGAAPTALDTLAEISSALGNDANYAASMTTALALKAPLNNAPLTGTPTAPTPATADNTTKVATTAHVQANSLLKENKIWRGPEAPTDPTYTLWLKPFVAASDGADPTAATLATITIDSSGYANLQWSGATDDTGIAYYEVWRGTGSGSTPSIYNTRVDGTSWIDNTVAPSTTYKYQTKTVDLTGKKSVLSNTVSVTTNAPSLLTNPNLRALFLTDTALGSAADASNVSSISPQYGSLVGALTLTQATTANQPTVLAGQLNGKKVVKHVATGLQFIVGGLPTTITGPSTIYLVARVTPVSGVRSLVTGNNTNPYRGIGINASNKMTALAGGSPNNIAGTVTATDVWKVLVAVVDPTTGATRLYDNKRTTPTTGTLGTDTSLNSISSLKLGRVSGSSSAYTDMQWAALGLVEEAQSESDIQAGMDQLATMFGLTLTA